MGTRVRAKFRCVEITETYDGTFVAKLRPVMQRGSNSEENKMFWSYSPSGEMCLNTKGTRPTEVGAYYYIDIAPHEAGKPAWTLGRVTRNEHGGGEVELYHSPNQAQYEELKKVRCGLAYGSLKIGMEAKAQGALETLSKPGSLWQVEWVFAEPSDGTT